MNDNDLKKILLEYDIDKSNNSSQIQQLSAMVRSSMKRSIKTRPFSILQQLKVQITYLSKWFYFAHFLLSLFCLYLLFNNDGTNSATIFFSISPLFAIPSIVIFYRTVCDGMLELECACKYSLSQMYATKFLMLGISVTITLVCTWLLNGFILKSYNIRPLILGLVSFIITCIIILWFSKRNIITGFSIGGVWCVIVWGISISKNGRALLESISTLTATFILIGTLILGAILLNKFSRKISYEGEEKIWKLI